MPNGGNCQLKKAFNIALVLALWICSLLVLVPLFFVPAWWPWLLPFHFLGQALVIYPTVRPNCDWFGIVIKTFRTDQKEIWLTVDDGPDPGTTPRILELLKKFNAHATFFVIGDRVRAYPHLVAAILEHGHTIGNHTATHPSASFWAFSPKAAAREIDGAAAAIHEVAGVNPRWFRAPVGLANVFVHRIISARRMKSIGWSTRGFDTVEPDAGKVVRNIFRDVRPGAIVLLHERAGGAGTRPNSVLVVETVLERLQQDGYACVIPVESQLADGRAPGGPVGRDASTEARWLPAK